MGEALLISSCRQVHTFGVREPIDVIFCDAGARVVHVARWMRPWRIGPLRLDAVDVIELRAGAASEVLPGDLLEVREGWLPGSDG